MIGIVILIAVVVVFFLLKGSKTKDSHEVITEKEEIAMKNKEILKEKIQNDLKQNKIDDVYVSSHSKKYHYEGCRYFHKETMKKIPLDVAKKEGYLPCKVCAPKKDISA
jgi:predicted transcriptional regulator